MLFSFKKRNIKLLSGAPEHLLMVLPTQRVAGHALYEQVKQEINFTNTELKFSRV